MRRCADVSATECEEGARPRMRMVDMHCHLDFALNGTEVARAASAAGIGALCTTVEPCAYEPTRIAFADAPSVRTALGMHPWWIARGLVSHADVSLFEEHAANAPFIGEIGLDFAARWEGTFEAQVDAFARAIRSCGEAGGKVVSVHAVKAASAVLDILEAGDFCRRNAVIMHWFSGTSDELVRACDAGCYFSVGARMLVTKRGRAYARRIPADRLLVETDAPPQPGDSMDFAAWEGELAETLRQLDETCGPGTADRATKTGAALLGLAATVDACCG